MTRLAAMQTAAPSSARAERIRTRCRTELARQRRGASARAAVHGARARWPEGLLRLWQPTLAVLALAYITEVLGLASVVYRR